MTGKDAFRIWAPAGARWADWARPVPFAAIIASQPPHSTDPFAVPGIFYAAEPQENTALIIDTPGCESVMEGVALAKMGFRPVPLYNGTNGQAGAMALVDHRMMERALIWGALELERITISSHAPPAFLLDSNRTHRYKINQTVFDNSWDLYAQDMPSASYFLNNGIDRIVVRGEAVQKDLNRILYPFQKKGIRIFFTDGYRAPKEVSLKRPPRGRG